jgi:O-antigen/teichoic acid export membrane protein
VVTGRREPTTSFDGGLSGVLAEPLNGRSARAEQDAVGVQPISGGSPSARIVRGALALLSTQPLTWSTSLLLAVVVPARLGDFALGQSAVGGAVAGLAGTIAGGGIADYLVRRVASERGKAGALAVNAALLSIIAAGVAAIALGIIVPFTGIPVPAIVLRLWLAMMVVGAAQNILFSTLRGQERHRWFAWLNAASSSLSSLAGVAVLLFGGDLTGYLVAVLVTTIIVAIVGWQITGLRPLRTAPMPSLWRGMVMGGLPFVGMNLATRSRLESDRILLALLASTSAVGWYSAAFRIAKIAVFVPALIAAPLLPALSAHADDLPVFRQTVDRAMTMMFLLNVPICAMTIGVAPVLPDMLGWSDAFSRSVPVMMLLALQQPLIGMDIVIGTALIARHRDRYWMAILVAGTVVNIVGNLTLVPLFEQVAGNGAIGAASGTLLAEVVILAGGLLAQPRDLLSRESWTILARVTAAGCAMSLVTVALLSVWLPLAMLAGCAIFAALIVMSRVVRLSDLRLLADTMRRRTAARFSA